MTVNTKMCLCVLKQIHHVRVANSTLQWRHNGYDSVSNHQPHGCLLSRLFRCRSKKTSKLRATGLCEGNSPGTGEFPAQMASNAETVSIWWRHHEFKTIHYGPQHLLMQIIMRCRYNAINFLQNGRPIAHQLERDIGCLLWSQTFIFCPIYCSGVIIMMMSSYGNIFCVTGPLWGISPVPVNSPHNGQWRGVLMFSFICV